MLGWWWEAFLSDDWDQNWQNAQNQSSGFRNLDPAAVIENVVTELRTEIMQDPQKQAAVQDLINRATKTWFRDSGDIAVNHVEMRYAQIKNVLVMLKA